MKKTILLGMMTAAVGVASAQDSRTSYFLDGFLYRHMMNPAMANEQSYFSLPMMGNMDISLNGNVGLSNFIHPMRNAAGQQQLTTFMNRSVSAQDFLGSLKSNNRLNANVDLVVMSTGFKAWGGYNTLSVGVHSHTDLNTPYELFDFMKTGQLGEGRTSYSCGDVQMRTNQYVDLTLGHSRQITEKLRVGGNLKFLVGVGSSNVDIEKLDIMMSEDEWIIDAHGEIETSYASNPYTLDQTSGEITGFELSNAGISSWGMAIDLGATYELIDGLMLSASIKDLGFLRSKKTYMGRTNNELYSFKGFEVIGIGSDSDAPTFDDQLDQLGEDLEDLIKFYDNGTKKGLAALSSTLHIGAEYALPMYDKLSFGVLSTTHFNRPFTWTEGRLSANISPTKWFDATLSGSYSNFGLGYGFLLNFHPKGFNFFVGSDFFLTEVTPQFIPVNNANANVTVGVNFPLN